MSDFNSRPSRRKSSPVGLIVGGVVVLVAVAAGAWLFLSNQADSNREPLPQVTARALRSADCSWLSGAPSSAAANEAHILVGGAAGDPATATTQVSAELKKAGYKNVVDANIRPIDKSLCAAFDSLRGLTASPPKTLFATRGGPYAIGKGFYCPKDTAQATVAGDFPKDATEAVAMVHFGPGGVVEVLFVGRDGYAALQKKQNTTEIYKIRTEPYFSPVPAAKSYVLDICEKGAGAHGVLVVRGDPAVLAKLNSVTNAESFAASGFGEAAAKAGVKAQLDWNRVE